MSLKTPRVLDGKSGVFLTGNRLLGGKRSRGLKGDGVTNSFLTKLTKCLFSTRPKERDVDCNSKEVNSNVGSEEKKSLNSTGLALSAPRSYDGE